MISHLLRKLWGTSRTENRGGRASVRKVGVITRIEAFLNSLSHVERTARRRHTAGGSRIVRRLPGREERHERYERYERTAAGDGVSAAAVRVYRVDGTLPEPERKTHGSAAGLRRRIFMREKRTAPQKEYCTPFSAAAGQIANRLQGDGRGGEKQFLVFQTEGAEADGMVPEILRAVLDADGKRAHLVTPFLEQLLFAEEADILWQVLLLGDAWHCLDEEEWREKVRASFRGEDRRRRMPGAGSGPKAFTGVGGICDGGQTAAAGRRSDCAA